MFNRKLASALAALTLITPHLALSQTEAATKPAPLRIVKELRLQGIYADLPTLDLGLAGLLGGDVGMPKDFFQLVTDLKAVAKKGEGDLLLDLSSGTLSLNDAQVAELERTFAALRSAKVKTTAYLENATTRHYLVASLCDRILMTDLAVLDFAAPSLSVMHMKDAMDLLGVQFQATRAGAYKGAVEPFVLSEMSAHGRAHYKSLIESMNAGQVQIVSTRRNLPVAKVRELQGKRLIRAKEAKEAGLVDELVPWRGARSAVTVPAEAVTFESIGRKKEKAGGFNFMSLLTGGFGKDGEKRADKDCVAVLHLSGTIVDGAKEAPGSIVSGPTVDRIRKLSNDRHVKGLVVRVNSPGGSGTASEAVLLALRDFAAKKPVSVSMGTMAASGGYYVSMVGGSPIFAEHGTITGSIGVFGMRPNVAALARRIGIRNEVVALDESSALDDIFRALPDAQLAPIEAFVQDFYAHFRRRILEARTNLTDESLSAIAEGRVWSGQQAVELGLVDKIGGLDDAVAYVREKIGGDEDLPVVSFPEPSNNPLKMFEDLLGLGIGERGGIEALRAAGFDLRQTMAMIVDALQHPAAVRVWALMPCEIVIR